LSIDGLVREPSIIAAVPRLTVSVREARPPEMLGDDPRDQPRQLGLEPVRDLFEQKGFHFAQRVMDQLVCMFVTTDVRCDSSSPGTGWCR